MSVQSQTAPTVHKAVVHNASARNRKRLSGALITVILIAGSIIMMMPFVWLVVSSFKLEEKIFLFPPEWIPNPFRWQNYPEALLYKPFGLYLFNTLRIVVFNLVAILLLSLIHISEPTRPY